MTKIDEKQISLFDGAEQFKITKPLRLITLFSGYDSQALALKYLGLPFEHYRTCEWAIPSIQALKDLHFGADDKDYAKWLTKEDLVQALFDKGVSADYNKPLTITTLRRYSEQKLKEIYNNICASHNLVSICNAKGNDLGITETDKYDYLMTYSFPCFPRGSLVLTENGYKPIEEVLRGDMVLTHDNTYQRVVRFFDNGVKPLLKINAMGVDEIKCTKNHLFLVRTLNRSPGSRKRIFGDAHWKKASDLTKKDYLGIAINQKAEIHKWHGINFIWANRRKPLHKNEIDEMQKYYGFWWIIGRYIADGWLRQQGGIIICCPKQKLDELERAIGKFFKYSIVKERTIYKIHIANNEIGLFCAQFGKGALNKRLTDTILDLPKHLLRGFLSGYMCGDGCKNGKENRATTVSRELVYGLAQCVAKVYNMPYGIYKTVRPPKGIIKNRLVNQHDIYTLIWKDEPRKAGRAFFENEHIWFPIREIKEIAAENVYDIEVENNHSFTVQGTIVHNCQDLSTAGKMQGMSRGGQTRSGMLWEVERLLKETAELPQVLLMENVKQVIGTKNIKDFSEWVAFLDKLGYKSKWHVLTATQFGIPQNRERCFMVSILGDHYYEMPKPRKLTHTIGAVLETNVDKKYYLKKEQIAEYKKFNLKHKAKGNGFRFTPGHRGGGNDKR